MYLYRTLKFSKGPEQGGSRGAAWLPPAAWALIALVLIVLP